MLVIPVLDLLNGVVVRGVGGRRDEYRPVESVLTSSAQPRDVARAFRDRLNLATLYVADLDGILRQRPNEDVYQQLAEDGFEFWIDAGVRSLSDVTRLLNAGAAKVVVGLESVPDARLLSALVAEFGALRIVFSLDLQAGRPMLGHSDWPDLSPLGIAQNVLSLGLTQLIVLDLASVGEQRGPSTIALCEAIRRIAPQVRLITGGGVRDADDLLPLQAAGIDGVLLATALHKGKIGQAELSALARGGEDSHSARSAVLSPRPRFGGEG
ncbi:MAG: hisA/hisF family protein [Planctomycetaceae bacterium]|nr:hisA/hisF family protein [Planctomycetaceae bacterium]